LFAATAHRPTTPARPGERVKNAGQKPLHAGAKELIAKIGRVEVQYLPRAMNKEVRIRR
jgi:hypothetical protein